MRTISILFTFLAVLCCREIINPAVAQAEAFKQLAGDRVVLEIFGYQVVLPSSDPDAVMFLISRTPSSQKSYFFLRDALAEPEKTVLLFKQEPKRVIIYISSGSPKDNSAIFGRFGRHLIPTTSLSSPLSIVVERSPQVQTNPRGKLPKEWPASDTGPDEDGFLVRPGVISSRRTSPEYTAYILPASQRLRPSSTDLVVFCSPTGARVRECKQTLKTADGRVGVGWSWQEDQFPKPTWRELDLRLHEVAEYLLSPSTAGDLE